MAINHNFKEGIDWAADPTGETPLANHLFVSEDSTSTEDGSPQNPYNTVEAALTAAVAGDTIIVGTGLYNINTYVFSKLNITIIADGYVLFNGNSNGFISMDSNASITIENVRFLNYTNLNYSTTNSNTSIKFDNCFLLSSPYDQSYNLGIIDITNCIMINSDIILPSRTGSIGTKTINNSIFINSRYEWLAGLSNCYLDADSYVYFINENLIDSFLSTNFNNIRCPIQIEGTTYASLADQIAADNRINQNSIDVPAGFNSEINYVFSLSPTSQMISKGENGSNITGRFVGDGYYRGVTEMDAAVDANANIEYNGINEVIIGAGGGNSEVLGEIVKGYDDLTIAGKIEIAGFLDMINMIPDADNTLVNPNNLILEMAFAGVDEVYTAYKNYRWDEIPTNNTDGTANGVSTYNWDDNNRIICQFIKVRITILNDGIYNRS